MLQNLNEITGSRSQLNFGVIPYRENELMNSRTDNSDLIKLGWKPETSIIKGIKKTIEWLQSCIVISGISAGFNLKLKELENIFLRKEQLSECHEKDWLIYFIYYSDSWYYITI